MTGAQVLAAVDPDKVTPGLLGFLVVAAIGLATWGLLRSLNHHLKKVNFEERPPEKPAERGHPPSPRGPIP